MKKLFLACIIATFCSLNMAQAQSHKIGRIDKDGIYGITLKADQVKTIIENISQVSEPMAFRPTDISLTATTLGEICLTGYIKGPTGNIIKGFRIICMQDDENNLIVQPGSRVERVNGRSF